MRQFYNARDWPLITGMGGGYKTGVSEVLPLRKRGGGKSFSHAEGGGGIGTKRFGVVCPQ